MPRSQCDKLIPPRLKEWIRAHEQSVWAALN
jgi:hypothetical protein